MKKRETIRQELGITQEVMAALLNIKRSQLAMYELGERDLPTTAMVLLAEMQLFLQSSVAKRDIKPKIAPEKKRQFLIMQHSKNQYQKEKISREIKAIEKKHQAHDNTLKLIAHLELHSRGKTATLDTILEKIAIRAKKGLARQDSSELTTLYFKHEVLEQEEAWLKAALKIE